MKRDERKIAFRCAVYTRVSKRRRVAYLRPLADQGNAAAQPRLDIR